MPHRRAGVGLAAFVVALAVVSLVVPAGAAEAKGKVVWLCRPGQEHTRASTVSGRR
jgi:ABC-type sugar transport system substrate-binding protein